MSKQPTSRAGALAEPTSPAPRTIRVGAVGDLHCAKTSQGQFQPLFAQIADLVDVLLLAGDLTDYGSPEEAHVLLKELLGLKMQVVAVLGNHDYEAGKQDEIIHILTEGGVKVLAGDSSEVLGIGIAGIKGFAGGFGKGTLGAWGEPVVKAFVHEAVEEALKLESALARLRMPQRVALLHYAPIEATCDGEPREIYPFLGCGRLAEPLRSYPVTAVFHGHAHRGALEGRIGDTVPVYNVSLPLLRRHWPDRPPVRIIEMRVAETAGPAH